MKRLLSRWPFDHRDGLLLVGFSALVYGVSQVSIAAAWMTAGVVLLAGWVAPLLPRKKGS